MLLKVEGTPYSKDTNSHALLATNRSLIQENEARKKLSKSISDKNNEINRLKNQVEEMSSDMKEVKSLLNQLLEKSR